MVIKASSATEIRQLIAALGGDDEVRREAAIARLSVIGARALDRLLAAYGAGVTRETKVAILRALEGIGDRRAVKVAREGLGEAGDVAIAAVATLRALLNADHAPTAAEALDALVSAALSPSADRRVRLAAVDALRDVPGNIRDRVAAALKTDADAGLQARAEEGAREAANAEAIWSDALEGHLPDAPADLRDVIRARGTLAPLGVLRKLVDAVRQKEESAAVTRRSEWLATRGALHQALALRNSRIAVYDLRETLAEARTPLPTAFLSALHVVGDESCLEPIAAAFSQGPADPHWRHQLASAFRAIAKRERITKRHAAMKRILARWPEAVDAFTAA